MSFKIYNIKIDVPVVTQGPPGPQGPQGPPGLSNGESHINILVNNIETQVYTGQNIVFTTGILVDFDYTGEGYRFKGSTSDIIEVSVNIQYRSLSELPYEIVSFVFKVNNVPKFTRKYGFDMQERIKDEFIIELNPDDIIEFTLEDLHNSDSPAAAIESKSFITLKSLQVFQDLNLITP